MIYPIPTANRVNDDPSILAFPSGQASLRSHGQFRVVYNSTWLHALVQAVLATVQGQ
jgi:hypothetical protein